VLTPLFFAHLHRLLQRRQPDAKAERTEHQEASDFSCTR